MPSARVSSVLKGMVMCIQGTTGYLDVRVYQEREKIRFGSRKMILEFRYARYMKHVAPAEACSCGES
jgi:hypothetical protein